MTVGDLEGRCHEDSQVQAAAVEAEALDLGVDRAQETYRSSTVEAAAASTDTDTDTAGEAAVATRVVGRSATA